MHAVGAEPLQRYLRVLWNIAPELRLDAEAPALRHDTIRLPPQAPAGSGDAWAWQRAAAAHAGAHRVFSPARFDGRGLRPLVRVLVGLLEDARVEALAGRDLPGLRRLWASLHRATPADGTSVPALLARLARALADPGYADPHPWVAKGRALFYADARGEVLALGDPAGLRQAASRLGHDLGQMRLGFDARAWRPVPAYRDDNAWMWPAEAAEDEPPAPAVAPPVAPPPVHERLPEWDRLIGRLRHDWVGVLEHDPAESTAALAAPPATLRRATQQALRPAPDTRTRGLQEQGTRFDLDALVRARLARWLDQSPDPRVFARAGTRRRPGRVLLLVDASASSGDALPGATTSVLQASLHAAALLAPALQAQGRAVGVAAFASEGRTALHWHRLQGLHDAPDDTRLRCRLAALRPGGSTRLGAVLRAALARLGGARPGEAAPVLLLVGDGQPHDIDVHDPRYLGADLRHALAQARRRGVRVLALLAPSDGLAAARRTFGPGASAPLWPPAALPRALARWRP